MIGRGGVRLALVAVTGVVLSSCDDQVKYVSWFHTMTETPAIETYEAQPMLPPDGAVAVGAEPEYDLLSADTLLTSPLTDPRSAEVLERGGELFVQFCQPCHGETGAGDGPVVGPDRLPALPTANLLSERARDLSDGYVWGMIGYGRGVMPDYNRVPRQDRWYIVAYVRSLQAQAPIQAR